MNIRELFGKSFQNVAGAALAASIGGCVTVQSNEGTFPPPSRAQFVADRNSGIVITYGKKAITAVANNGDTSLRASFTHPQDGMTAFTGILEIRSHGVAANLSGTNRNGVTIFDEIVLTQNGNLVTPNKNEAWHAGLRKSAGAMIDAVTNKMQECSRSLRDTSHNQCIFATGNQPR